MGTAEGGRGRERGVRGRERGRGRGGEEGEDMEEGVEDVTKYTLCPLTQLIEMRISTISIFFALQGKCMHVHSVMGSILAWHISVICTPTLKKNDYISNTCIIST